MIKNTNKLNTSDSCIILYLFINTVRWIRVEACEGGCRETEERVVFSSWFRSPFLDSESFLYLLGNTRFTRALLTTRKNIFLTSLILFHSLVAKFVALDFQQTWLLLYPNLTWSLIRSLWGHHQSWLFVWIFFELLYSIATLLFWHLLLLG